MFGAVVTDAGTKTRKRTPHTRRNPSQTALALLSSLRESASPTHRTPILLLRLIGSFLLRFDTRTFCGLLFQEPPRSDSVSFHSGHYATKNFPGGFAAHFKTDLDSKREKLKE
jgi:hypothetical protein